MKCFKCGSTRTYVNRLGTETWVTKADGTYCFSCWNRKIASGVNHKGKNNPNFGHKHPNFNFNKKCLINLKRYMGAEGKDNPSWKGGISSANQRARGMKKYHKWRKKIYIKDAFTCQKCNRKDIRLNAHHIKPFAAFPKLRYRLNNGITLCIDCHKLTNSYKTNKSTIVNAINP